MEAQRATSGGWLDVWDMREGGTKKDPLADYMNGGVVCGNGKYGGRVGLNNLLWEILPERSNRQLNSPGLKGEV